LYGASAGRGCARGCGGGIESYGPFATTPGRSVRIWTCRSSTHVASFAAHLAGISGRRTSAPGRPPRRHVAGTKGLTLRMFSTRPAVTSAARRRPRRSLRRRPPVRRPRASPREPSLAARSVVSRCEPCGEGFTGFSLHRRFGRTSVLSARPITVVSCLRRIGV